MFLRIRERYLKFKTDEGYKVIEEFTYVRISEIESFKIRKPEVRDNELRIYFNTKADVYTHYTEVLDVEKIADILSIILSFNDEVQHVIDLESTLKHSAGGSDASNQEYQRVSH